MSRKYPAVFYLLFVLVGIVLADQTRWPAEWFLLSALILCLIGIALFRSSPKAASLLFGLFMLSFSGYHFSIRYYDIGPGHITNFVTDGERYRIFGEVIDWPLLKSSGTEIKIRVDSLGPPVERAVDGAIMLKIHDSTTALQRGDRIEFRSRIFDIKGGRSPGGFDYRRYLHLKGVFGVVYLNNLLDVRINTEGRSTILSWIDLLRSEITASFYRNLGEAGASLAAGFLIGETRNISPEVYQRFRDSGTLHLLAVSGSNVALVLAFVIIMLRPLALRRWNRAFVLLAVVVAFSLVSYGEPSVVRASIMASLVIGAGLVQRRYDLNNIIATAALIILLYDPAQLYQVGFQLSFMVAWGLIYLLPRIHALFAGYHGRRWYRWLVLPTTFSLIAQVCAAPLIAFYFQRVPLISPLANLVIVPLVSLAVIASLCLLVADLIFSLLGAMVGSLLNLHMNLILYLLAFFGGDHVPVWKVAKPSLIAAVAVYFALGVGAPALRSRRWRRILVFGLLLLVNLALGLQLGSAPRCDSLDVFKIPGGVCSVLKRPNSAAADMIITGVPGRSYQIDEKILAPALVALEVDKINNLVILSAEFWAIDDLLRLASKYEVEHLYVRADNKAAFTDVAGSMGVPFDSLSTVYFSGPIKFAEPLRDGWRVGGDGAELTVGSVRIMFVDYPDQRVLERLRPRPPDVLVVGRSIDRLAPIYDQLRQAGASYLIAAGVSGSAVRERLDGALRTTSVNPDYFIDLSRMGGTRLQLQDQPSQAIRVVSGT